MTYIGFLSFAKIITAFFAVFLLMYFALKLMQKYTKFGVKYKNNSANIKIDSILYIDDTNKIVSLKSKKKYYMIAVNKNTISLIDKYDHETV
ncbi:MAG: hypothetical protein AB8B67_04745 [Rickettsiaceae bacterium]